MNGASDVVQGYLIGVKHCEASELPNPFADAGTPHRRRDASVKRRVRSRTPGAVGDRHDAADAHTDTHDDYTQSIYRKTPSRNRNLCSRMCEYIVRKAAALWK